MILKYEEYIKEGLWSKGIERSKSDVDRLEHKLTQSYVEDIFNPQKYHTFMRENKLYDVIKIFSDKLDNTYIDFIYNYAKQHGTLEIGFGKDDKCPLPDFDFSFNIETLDNIKIHVFFHNSTKELKVMCGKKDEFDISETKFGSHLIETIQELPENILYNEPKILEDNIRKNWEIFQKLLHKQIYDMIYDEVKDDIKHGIDDLPISCYTPIDLNSNKDLYRFYFRGVNFEGSKVTSVILGDDNDIKKSSLGENIVDIYMLTFDEIKNDIKKEVE